MNYVLKLYVSGKTPYSVRALVALQRICEEELTGRYALEVIDVMKYPEVAEREKITATPTLVKEAPAPTCRMVGDLTDRDKARLGLGLVLGAEESLA